MAKASLVLSQRFSLVQKIMISAIMNKPIKAVDRTIDAIIEDPHIVDQVPQFSQAKSGGIRFQDYSSLLERLIYNENSSGATNGADQFVPVSGNAVAANSDGHLVAQPDITYVVKENGDWSITHSGHLNKIEPGIRALQVTKNVQPFLRWLIKQRNCITDSLMQAYAAIGKKQAGFLFYLEPQQLVVLTQMQLPSETGTNYSNSFYSRLLQGKSVRIESPNGSVVLPIAFLLPNQDDVAKYDATPLMNAVFEQELKQKEAYNDNQISQRIRTIKRRTVLNYRLSAGIPGKSERQLQYKQGKSEPYKIRMAIEAYLPNR